MTTIASPATHLVLEKVTLNPNAKNNFNFLGNIDKGYFFIKGCKDIIYCRSSEIHAKKSIHWITIFTTTTKKIIKWPHYFNLHNKIFTALYYAESNSLLAKSKFIID